MSLLHEKSIAELEALIENWMMALGAMSTPYLIDYCRGRIKEAEKVLQAKREAEQISPEDLEAAAEMFVALEDGDFYKRQEEAERWLRGKGAK